MEQTVTGRWQRLTTGGKPGEVVEVIERYEEALPLGGGTMPFVRYVFITSGPNEGFEGRFAEAYLLDNFQRL